MTSQITEVRLLAVPLERDYKHTLYFNTPLAQEQYFIGKTKFNESNFSYQRKDGYIRYPKHFDDLQECNYIMYRNGTDYKSMWYYAFITDMVYKGDETTWIYFETDVIQTYLFEYNIKPSFVEREHVNDDTIGLHTYPENLECGEFIVDYNSSISDLAKTKIVMGVSDLKPLDSVSTAGLRVNGLYSGISYLAWYPDESVFVTKIIKEFDEEGGGDSIQCLFMAPEFLTKTMTFGSGDKTYKEVVYSEKPGELSYSFNKPINDTPVKNNKLKTFPYKYLMVSNNNGGSAILHYEHFKNDLMEFTIKGVLSPGCSIRLHPKDYKGIDENIEEGLNLGKYPILNWNSDIYTNWLTQNSVNIGLNIVSGVGQVIAGTTLAVASGGVGAAVGGGQIVGGLSSITNQLTQIHQMSFTPDQSKGNLNCGDVITASNNNTFHFYGMTIKEEYMKIIDDYFSMFGYKCNRVKIPFENHRKSYWYTKTIDVNIDCDEGGKIPPKDLEKIKNCYNNGITFWRSTSVIGDYSVDNEIKE